MEISGKRALRSIRLVVFDFSCSKMLTCTSDLEASGQQVGLTKSQSPRHQITLHIICSMGEVALDKAD